MDVDLLARIVNVPGISGFEDAAQDLVAGEMRSAGLEVTRDRIGNVIGLRNGTAPWSGSGPRPRVVLAAHIDEIGMAVKHIDSDGYVRIQQIGGLFPQCLQSQPVIIHGKQPVKGVVAPNMSLRAGDPQPGIDDLLIDTGLSRAALLERVTIGDAITCAQELVALNDDVWMGRNFDDRMGTFCLIEALRDPVPTVADIYYVSTVQEEVGVRGMPVAAHAIKPDMGLAIDGSLVRAAHVKPHSVTCEMGQGTGIYLMDNLTLGDRRLIRFLIDLCEQASIPYQRNIGGGTDASAIQRSGSGALATTIGPPTRYMHSTVQLCHRVDIEATTALLRAFAEHAHELWQMLE